MPWRHPRKRVERPIEVTRSIEESLEDAAAGEEEEDSVDLAGLDDATIVEAATGEPEPERGASDLALKLRETLAREPAPARARPRATTYPESGVDLAVEVARKYGVQWAALGVPVIVNVAGYSVEDYVYVVSAMAGTPGVVAYELNVSCPNVRDGMIFGSDPSLAAELTRAVKAETDLPVIVKLTPNAPDVVAVARACEEAGADGVTAINTVLGMRIDTRRRRPILGTGSGGGAGPAGPPIPAHITYQGAQAGRVPTLGGGGGAR